MKLLFVNLQNPCDTKYHNPKQIGSHLWGRRLSNYPMFAVDENGNMKPIVVNASDAIELYTKIVKEIDPNSTYSVL